MKFIGIGGNSATGKTTLSNLISSYNDDIEVIHLDGVLDGIKKRIVKKENLDIVHQDEETYYCLQKNPFHDIKNSTLKRHYHKFRNIFISTFIKAKSFKMQKQGYHTIIVEGVSLEGLSINWDYLVKTEAPTDLRLERRIKRDDREVDKEKLQNWDKQDRENAEFHTLDYDRVIQNTGNIIEMDHVAKEIYNDACAKPTQKKIQPKRCK